MKVIIAVNLQDGHIANAESLLKLRDKAEIVFVTPKKRYELQDIQLAEIDRLNAKLQSSVKSTDSIVFHIDMDEVLHSHAVEYLQNFYQHNPLGAEIPGDVRALFVSYAEPVKPAASEISYLASCIMPIYNGAKFLHEAINSVINQTIGFENVQLILVDGNSNDGSGQICDEYASKYPNNIVYIRQGENDGIHAARNAGLDVATGTYITFLKTDDFFELNYMEECLDLLQSGNTNFVAAQVTSLNEGLILNNNHLPYICRITKNATFTQQSNSHYIFKSISGAMFASTLLGDVRFNPQSAPFSEGFFVLDILLKSESKFLYAVINNTGIVKRDLANKQIDIQSLAFLESMDLHETLGLISAEIKKHVENGAKTSFVQWSLLGNLGLYQGIITPEAILLSKDIFEELEIILA